MVKFNLAADWGSKGLGFETALATLTTAAALGGLVGGLVVSAWGGLRQRRVIGVLVPMIISGVSLILFGLVPLLYVVGAMLFVGGFCMPMMNAHSQSIWQTQTPPELQGRVFSVRRVIAQFTGPLSLGVVGLSAGVFDPGLVLVTLGLLFALFSIVQLFNPMLHRVEDKEYLDGLGAEPAVVAQ